MHPGKHIADRLLTQVVSQLGYRSNLWPAGREQRNNLSFTDFLPSTNASDDLAYGTPRRCMAWNEYRWGVLGT